MPTCRKHNIKYATYGECSECCKEVRKPLSWPRTDPAELAKFDPRTKQCTMNCGPHSLDPRSRKERLFQCDECSICSLPPAQPEKPSELDSQRNALSEARGRIIARSEQIKTWLKNPPSDDVKVSWEGMIEGLNQARRIIGAMWDELPVPKPQAVIDHEAHMPRLIEEQNMNYPEANSR